MAMSKGPGKIERECLKLLRAHEENAPVPIGIMAGPMATKIFELTDPETPMDLCRWHSASQSTRRALRNLESQGLIWACSEFGQRQKFWRAVMSV